MFGFAGTITNSYPPQTPRPAPIIKTNKLRLFLFLFNFRMLSVPSRLGRISLPTGYGKIANQDYLIQSTPISIKRTPQIIINIEKVRAAVTGD